MSPISRALIEKHDSDRYFLSLLASSERAADLWPVLAFYYEISRTREMVTDTTMGLIRLQWWKDAFKAYYEAGALAPHEIFPELARVITAHNLPQYFFQNLLMAREFDIEDRVPAHFDGLLTYIQFAHTPLVKLCAMILGDDIDDQSIGKLSMAYGMVGILRAFVFHARARRCYLPADKISNIEDVYQFKNIDDLKPLVKDLCDYAEISLNDTRPKSSYFRGMKTLCRLYIQQIRGVDYNLISPKLLMPPKFKQLRVWFGARFG